jgi:type VI secretion system protein ImpA
MPRGENVASDGSAWGHGVSVDEAAGSLVERFLQPLPDASAPCGPDLEYDNAVLALNQSAAGRPESQWDAGEPPNWPQVRTQAEALFERSRDLRVAVLWLRAMVNLSGLAALGAGLKLLHGLLDTYWDTLHPQLDPDDGDAYARMNALAVLREPEGLLGDLRQALVFSQRGVGELRVRHIEIALNQLPPRSDETPLTRSQLEQMLQAAVAQDAALRPRIAEAASQVKALISLLNERVGMENAVDLKPLWSTVSNVLNLLPAPAEAEPEAAAAEVAPAASDDGSAPARRAVAAAGLSGSVNSREEAVRAIDMVCEYLERAEPTSPAPLLLRRARRLVNRNFLQLMKELAPDALGEVARVMGVDPESVQLDDAG